MRSRSSWPFQMSFAPSCGQWPRSGGGAGRGRRHECHPFHDDGRLTGAACWRADRTSIGVAGGLARSGLRLWLRLTSAAISLRSSNAWDAYAASAFGMQVVWCNRYAQRRERLPGSPLGENCTTRRPLFPKQRARRWSRLLRPNLKKDQRTNVADSNCVGRSIAASGDSVSRLAGCSPAESHALSFVSIHCHKLRISSADLLVGAYSLTASPALSAS